MIQDNDKLKKVIDRVIKTYYGDRVHVYKSSFYDYDDEFFEYELHYKVIPDCKIENQKVRKNYKFCDVPVNIVKFTLNGEKNYHRDDIPESSWDDFEDDTVKFLVDNFPSVDFVPEIRSENLND